MRNEKLVKTQVSFIICFTRRAFPFYTSQIHGNNILFFYFKDLPVQSSGVIFIFFTFLFSNMYWCCPFQV